MRVEDQEMKRLGEGGEHPSSLEAKAGAFLREARPTVGLGNRDVAAIAERWSRQEPRRGGPLLVPILAALAVLCAAGAVMAWAGGWRPRIPFLGSAAGDAQGPPRPTPKLRARDQRPPAPAVTPTKPSSPALPAAAPEPVAPPRGRIARVESSPPAPASPGRGVPAEGALSVEARSLADALARWRRDGKAEAALALLAAHERRFPRGELAVEARVARAEILLALGRGEPALAVLDSLALANLPRARELFTLRGELRARVGRCGDARADLSGVLASTADDDLGKRAVRALASCR